VFWTRARRAELALLVVTLTWGLTFPMIKLGLGHAPPFAFLALRCPVGLLCLWPLMGWRRPAASSWLPGLLVGCVLALAFYMQTLGLVTTTATRSAFITGLSVVFVPVFYPLLTRRAPGRWPVLGALIAVVGLYLFTRPESGGLNRGDLFTLMSALLYALYVIGLEIATRRHPYEDMIVIQATVLGVGFLPAALVEGGPVDWNLTLATSVVVTGVILAVTVYLMNRFQRDTTATRAAVVYTAEPVFAAGFAWVLLGEVLSGLQALGAAVILLGIASATRRGPGTS
jgi:drug/metabolite transporter (DMT)-like permease